MEEFSDFRSDTVTRPTESMKKAMVEAEVGDDVLGDDPTVQKLEVMASEIIGKQAALFVPSGTMGNAIAIKVWTRELDEIIVEAMSHIYNMESTHLAFISRVNPRVIFSERGAMDPKEVERNIRKPSVHIPRTSLICLENTHNFKSGAVVPIGNFKELREIANNNGLKIHLDGARIFNASHASGTPVREYAEQSDSLMFCLSKGLSAPVGSILAGPENFIDYARRVRKALGGGMRQVGILAAAGIVALSEMRDRLKDDHNRAKELAFGICGLPGISLNPENIQTNIIIFDFNHPEISISDFLAKLRDTGILALSPSSGKIRLVTHKDVGDGDVKRAISSFKEILTS
ncbi:GntG family PLP-dependent aldolase [Acidobacteriota bacterium]